jgi:Flp pilus assembly protein TadB
MMKLLYVTFPPLIVIVVALRTYLTSVNALRTSKDVLRDLSNSRKESSKKSTTTNSKEGRGAFVVLQKYLPLFLGTFVSSLHATTLTKFSTTPLILGGVAVSTTYLIQKRFEERATEKKQENLEFYLPVVMERIVMAVQAGLDIIPALEAVFTLGEKEAVASGNEVDPVTLLVGHVMELHRAGQSLEETLAQVGKESQATGVRHAFIHLSLAHRDGGELMAPLRELSDATQLYYQESVEEIIAKLPIKATLPLLCTFAGLIICFLTVPIIEVMSMTQQSLPSGPSF